MKKTARVTTEKMSRAQRDEIRQKNRKFPFDTRTRKLVHADASGLWATLEMFASHGLTERHMNRLRKEKALLAAVGDFILLDGFAPVSGYEAAAVNILGAENVILAPSFFLHLGGLERRHAQPISYHSHSSRSALDSEDMAEFQKMLRGCGRENALGTARWVMCYLHGTDTVTANRVWGTLPIFTEGLDPNSCGSWFSVPITQEGYYLLDFGVEKFVGRDDSARHTLLLETKTEEASDEVVLLALALGLLSKHRHLMPPGSYHHGNHRHNGNYPFIGVTEDGFIDVRTDVPDHLMQFLGKGGPGMVRSFYLGDLS